MKTHKLIMMILALFLSACDEQLIEEPRDILSPSQFFNTDEEAIGVVNGLYSRAIPFIYGGGGSRSVSTDSHAGTDISRPAGGRELTYPAHAYTFSPSEDGPRRDNWETFYRTVADANLVIARVEASKDNFSPEVYDQSIGQAKVVRALMYYWLTNYWGDVPMWLDELDIDEVSSLPRSPVAEIYSQLVVDLEDAAAKLPPSWEGPNLGRASKWAAMMLLTKIYMLQSDWLNAKTTAGKIINESPHTLMPEYGMIFGIDNEYNKERIWERDALQDQYQVTFSTGFTPRANDEPRFEANETIDFELDGFAHLTATNEFITSFDVDDKRKPFYNLNGVFDDPDGDGVYDNWVPFNFNYVIKLIDRTGLRGNSGSNVMIYRLADAYLMYAEAENELNGPTVEAYDKINRIRDRAFGNNPLKHLSALSKEEFRQAILDERKWELAFEFHRRWDLKRWGTLEEAVKSIAVTNPIGAANFKPYHVLFPIPFQEIQLNKNLTQNPGYE